MNPLAQKKLSVNDFRQIGEIVQSPINLEVPNSKYICIDGSDRNRSDWPELGTTARFPVGVFTSTSRTLAANPSDATIVADATNFLVPGVAGTDALQASADAVTWVTTTGGWAASSAFPSMIVAGPRFIIAPSAGESQPYFIAIGGTAANLVVKANWTVTTGGTVTASERGLSYDPATGITVLIKTTPLTTANGVFALSNNADTSWAAAGGGSTMNRQAIAFSGTKHIIVAYTQSNLYQTTTDGVTVTDAYFPFTFIADDIVSDGAGTVVVAAHTITNGAFSSTNGFIVTKDHGATWKIIDSERSGLFGTTPYLSFANGKFIATNSSGSSEHVVSSDGLTWFNEPISKRGKVISSDSRRLAYKSGVYCGVHTSGGALTAVEDMNKFKMPSAVAVSISAVGMFLGFPGNYYMKARG